MDNNSIVEIAKYRGINELACKSCGAVNPIEAIVIVDTIQSNHIKKYGAYCPECEAWIKWLPSHKAWRIFKNAREGMTEIEKIDNGYLTWYLRAVEKIQPDLRAAIEELMERRISESGLGAVQDAPENFKPEEAAQVAELIRKKKEDIKELIKSTTDLDATATDTVIRKLKLVNKSIKELERRLIKMEDNG